MSTQLQVQQAGEPEQTGGRTMSRLSRIIFLIFVFLLVAVSIYLATTVWGNLNNILSFTLSAVGSIASVIGLWAILFSSRDTRTQSSTQQIAPASAQKDAPIQITVNQTQIMAEHPPASIMNNANQPNEKAALEQTTSPKQIVQKSSQQQPVEKYTPQSVPPPTLNPSSQQNDVDEDDTRNLIGDLIRSSPSIFDAVIAYYDPPPGVAETGTKASKARELVNTARIKGNLQKLIDAYQLAMGEQPLEKRVQQELTDGTKQATEVAGQTMSIEREQNTQEAPSSSNVSQKQQETRESQTETNHDHPPETTPVTIVQQARNDVEKAQQYVQQADALFIKGKSASSEKFRDARSLLIKAKESTHHLQNILKTNASLPEPLKSKKTRIIGQINIVNEQIDGLLDGLKRGIQGDSGPLNDALSKIQEFISD